MPPILVWGGDLKVSPADYSFLAQIIAQECGIALGDDRQYLVESRLRSVVLDSGFSGISELVDALRSQVGLGHAVRPAPGKETLLCRVIDAITTNESLFFRDVVPFELLCEQLIPSILSAPDFSGTLRIWSAGCSTGQEPYSIVMSILERSGASERWGLEVLATDICQQALDRANQGSYNSFEIQRGMPAHFLNKYFEQVSGEWKISDVVKRHVTFTKLNLINPPPGLGIFDVIFCRNVLIYFGMETKRRVIEMFEGRLSRHGYLLLGGAETATGLSDQFERVENYQASIYRKRSDSSLAKLGLSL